MMRLASSCLLAASMQLVVPGLCRAMEVTLVVERERVAIGDTFGAEVSVLGGPSGTREPELLLNGNFRIIDRRKSHNVSFIGGRTTEDLRFQYTLQPLRGGVFDVGPAVVRTTSGDVSSATRRVRVDLGTTRSTPSPTRPSSDELTASVPADGAPRLLLLAQVDRREAWVGQRVTYQLELLARHGIRGATPRSEPTLTGLWAEPLDVPREPRPRRTQHLGSNWDGFLLRKAYLYPTTAGVVDIEPAIWDVTIVEPGFLSLPGRSVAVVGERVQLRVKRLPDEGRPADFAGVVGRVALSASLDRSSVSVGEGVVVRATLRGDANLAAAPAPTLPELVSFRVYPGRAVASVGGPVGDDGERSWDITIVGTVAGEFEIPPLQLSRFDPVRGRYDVVRSEPLPLVVHAAANDSAVAGTERTTDPGAGAVLPVAGEAVTRRDIADLKLRPGSPQSRRVPLYRHGTVRWSLLLPVLLNVGGVAVIVWRRRSTLDPETARRRGALGLASRSLATLSSSSEGAPAQLSSLLVGYVADRFGEPRAGLTRERMRVLLGSGVEVDAYLQVLERVDYLQFTPAGASPSEVERLITVARARLRALDRVLTKGRDEAAR